MESVQKVFLSLSERKLALMRILMPISGDGTQERGISLEIIGLIIDGLLLIQSFGSGSSAVILIWSVFFQSRASSIFTNMSIKAMIVLLWSLEDVWMRSNCIWIHVMSLHMRHYGDCFNIQCMRNLQVFIDFRFICLVITWFFGMRKDLMVFKMLYKGIKIQFSLDISQLIKNIQRPERFYTKTFLLNGYGITRRRSGQKESRVMLLGACTMLILILESAFISELFWLLSRGLQNLRISRE